MTTFKTIIVGLLLALPVLATDNLVIKNVKKKESSVLLFMFDTSGLTNYNSCKNLAKKNLAKYSSLTSKKVFKKQKVSVIKYFVFNEQIKEIGTIETTRYGKLFRKSKELIKKVESELKNEENLKKGKEVISLFPFINTLVEEQFSSFDNVGVVIFSNMRDSTLSKSERKQLKPIKINESITVKIFASSGLECLGASTKQITNAQKSVVKFYKKILDSKKLSIHTIY